ncbi:MarR family winged helix-turn-helix transcriptional regulator [Coxiella burnetii]|uniref:MarR family winged helix-turn-helix transcriptional regulator n=2 Tax=Coxiella burnetii TaxID=777 RepID=UPI0000ECFF21|nr:MarR family transcriptional regulator [Coxiella burnetii]ACJ20051.1 transcriptional regulator, MarR family [Coxiella burnetii CbuK_Q154]EAX33727.1 MarR family transcriptional regulator [Coxiella burnetii 'MSU Goat Q177']
MHNTPDSRLPMMLFKTAAAWRNELDRRLKPLGLSQAKWRTLMHLARAEEPLSQKILAAKMGIEGATLVGLLDRLAKDQWIVRQPDANDRRTKKIFLTEKSQTIISQIKLTTDALKKEVLTGISKKDYEACLNVLGQIKDKLNEFEL